MLGGFATLEACGHDGLVPDDAARRIFRGVKRLVARVPPHLDRGTNRVGPLN